MHTRVLALRILVSPDSTQFLSDFSSWPLIYFSSLKNGRKSYRSVFLFSLYDLIFDDPIGFFRLEMLRAKGFLKTWMLWLYLRAAGYSPFMDLELLHR